MPSLLFTSAAFSKNVHLFPLFLMLLSSRCRGLLKPVPVLGFSFTTVHYAGIVQVQSPARSSSRSRSRNTGSSTRQQQQQNQRYRSLIFDNDGYNTPRSTRCTELAMVSDPDPSILVSSKDASIQQLAFITAFGALAIGSYLCIELWHGPAINWIGYEFYENIRSKIFPIVFGSIFTIVGILHFVFDTNFVRIVPPKGTWGGLWQVPAPGMDLLGISYEQYHCYLSGIVEFVGGLWLLLAALNFGLTSTEIPAAILFLLTIAVTPANLYMFTHDAHPGGFIPKLDYPFGHIGRFIVQCGLLSNFWIMAVS